MIDDQLSESIEKRKRSTSLPEDDDFIGDMSIGSDPVKGNWTELQN